MKAYLVRDIKSPEDYETVVFGETRGKAIQAALATVACKDAEWVNIRATRVPALDTYYRGLPEIDWDNDNDKLAIVRHAYMHCSHEYDLTDCARQECPAKELCDRYRERIFSKI